MLFSANPLCVQAKDAVARGALNEALANIDDFYGRSRVDYHGHTTRLDWLVMPNPGRKARAYESLKFHSASRAYMEIGVPEAASGSVAAVYLDGLKVADLVQRAGEGLSLKFTGEKIASIDASKSASRVWSMEISRGQDGIEFCLSETCRKLSSGPQSVEVISHDSEVYLANPQHREGRLELKEPGSRFESIAAPRGVLAWEGLSKRLYHISISFMGAYAACASDSAADPVGCSRLRSEAPRVAASMLDDILKWSNWRTFDESLVNPSVSAGVADWDKGNWANGYMPFAAAAFAFVSDNWQSGRNAIAVRKKFEDVFYPYIEDPIYHANVAHWVRRSNNHGAIVIGNAYAAELLSSNCQESALSNNLLSSCRTVANGSFVDGVYVESFSYMQVFVMESLAAVAMRQRCFGETFEVAFSELYGKGQLENMAEVVPFVTGPAGEMLLPFGDCCGLGWRRDMLAVLATENAAVTPILEAGTKLAGGSASLLQLADLNPNRRQAPVSTGTLSCFSSDLGLAAADVETAFGRIQVGLSSTRAHLTHNKDWDLGAIYLALDGHPLVGERIDGEARRVRSALRHSGAWTDQLQSQLPGCFSSEAGACEPRKVNGALLLAEADDRSCSASVALSGSDRSRRNWRVRSHETPDAEVIVEVEDYVDLTSGTSVIHANLEIDGSVTLVGDEIRLMRDGVRVTLSIDGYEIISVKEVPGTAEGYTSVRLRGAAINETTSRVGRLRISVSSARPEVARTGFH
ncbi:hypothetical protein [Lysobacter zhanggongensis]|uniref:hypothetical protein n=1 Tax=Lysobacter zhanggongensis TaxID=1774951 RepID=UPI00399D4ABD